MSQKIKQIYFFHPIHKYFMRTGRAQEGLGLPENSTDLVPPKCPKGKVAIFHEDIKNWIVCNDVFDRTEGTCYELLYLNKNFHSEVPVIYAKSIGEFLDPNFAAVMNFFSALECFNNFVNPFLVSLTFKNRINHLNKRIKQLYNMHRWLIIKFSILHRLTIDESISFKVEKEEIVHEIKRLFDLLAITISIAHSGNHYFSSRDKLELDSIGQLWSNRNPVKPEIKEALLLSKYEPLLKLVNNLHNGLKHDILAEEYDTSQIHREILIHVSKFKNARSNLKNIDVYNIPLTGLLMACNDYISDVLTQTKIEDVKVRWYILEVNKFKL